MNRDRHTGKTPVEPSPIAKGDLPIVAAPADLWARIEAASRPVPRRFAWQWSIAVAAAAAMVAWMVWPRAGWIEPTTRQRIELGSIGVVDIEPGSRVRLATQESDQIRMVLAHGAIEANVTAPPRLFMVETPSALAVDLGCAYRLRTDEDGNGLLEVTGGWVSLERGGRESIVPVGANCKMRAGRGPGTPYFVDASPDLVAALDRFDTSGDGLRGEGLETILSAARPRDTLTLWHLLSRVQESDRARVFDRIAELAPPPSSIARERVLALDAEALRLWREELAWIW